MRKTLTGRQKKFVEEYLKDQNAAQAAVRAGFNYGSADQLLANPNVKSVIEARLAKIAEATDITAEKVVRLAWVIANSDIGDLFDANGRLKPLSELTKEQRVAIASIDEDELFEGVGRDREQVGVTKSVKLWDKVKAIELLMKKFKLLTDRVEHDVAGDLAKMLREARERRKNAK